MASLRGLGSAAILAVFALVVSVSGQYQGGCYPQSCSTNVVQCANKTEAYLLSDTNGATGTCCSPLNKFLNPSQYNCPSAPNQGTCAFCYGVFLTYDTLNITYAEPLDKVFAAAARPAFLATQTLNNTGSSGTIALQIVYKKATTTSFAYTFTEQLALGAKFSFEVGNCFLCPASAKTEYTITATVGSSQQTTETSTDEFSVTSSVTVPPGGCIRAVGSVNYIQDYKLPFTAFLNVTCALSLNLAEPLNPYQQGNSTCSTTQILDYLKYNGFTGSVIQGSVAGLAPYGGGYIPVGGWAVLSVAGNLQASFGTEATLTAQNCNSSPTVAAAPNGTLIAVDVEPRAFLNVDNACLDCITVTNVTDTSLGATANPGPYETSPASGADTLAGESPMPPATAGSPMPPATAGSPVPPATTGSPVPPATVRPAEKLKDHIASTIHTILGFAAPEPVAAPLATP